VIYWITVKHYYVIKTKTCKLLQVNDLRYQGYTTYDTGLC